MPMPGCLCFEDEPFLMYKCFKERNKSEKYTFNDSEVDMFINNTNGFVRKFFKIRSVFDTLSLNNFC